MSFDNTINFSNQYIQNSSFATNANYLPFNTNYYGSIFNTQNFCNPSFDNTTFNFPFLPFKNNASPTFNFSFPNIFESFKNIDFSDIFNNFTNNASINSSTTNNNWLSNLMSQPTWTSPTYKPSKTISSKKTQNLPKFQDVNYDPVKGQRIANEIKKVAKENGWQGNCGATVGNALNRAKVFNITSGRHGYLYPTLLKGNDNFVEISTEGLDLSTLPAGCIYSYDRGVAGYSKTHGDVQVALGDGRAASDGITHNIKDGARVFVPV